MLGISYIDIDSQMEAMYYRVSDYGVYVVSSEYTDELKAGDRIVGIDDEQVTYSSDIKAILKEHEVGDVVTIKVIRGGQYYDVEVTLHEYVPTTATTDTSAFDDKASDNSNLG